MRFEYSFESEAILAMLRRDRSEENQTGKPVQDDIVLGRYVGYITSDGSSLWTRIYHGSERTFFDR